MDERKLKILAAVVDEYILTGEPVGSKAISKVPGINVSAATIRNDMSVLEQLGYLEQPHTSAGRIPTFSGYRLYIDQLMTVEELSESERQRLDAMLGEEENLTEESIIQSAGRLLQSLHSALQWLRIQLLSSQSSPRWTLFLPASGFT